MEVHAVCTMYKANDHAGISLLEAGCYESYDHQNGSHNTDVGSSVYVRNKVYS